MPKYQHKMILLTDRPYGFDLQMCPQEKKQHSFAPQAGGLEHFHGLSESSCRCRSGLVSIVLEWVETTGDSWVLTMDLQLLAQPLNSQVSNFF